MAVSGQEHQFPLPKHSACSEIRKETVGRTRGNGQEAPIPAVRSTPIDRLKSTLSGPSAWHMKIETVR